MSLLGNSRMDGWMCNRRHDRRHATLAQGRHGCSCVKKLQIGSNRGEKERGKIPSSLSFRERGGSDFFPSSFSLCSFHSRVLGLVSSRLRYQYVSILYCLFRLGLARIREIQSSPVQPSHSPPQASKQASNLASNHRLLLRYVRCTELLYSSFDLCQNPWPILGRERIDCALEFQIFSQHSTAQHSAIAVYLCTCVRTWACIVRHVCMYYVCLRRGLHAYVL